MEAEKMVKKERMAPLLTMRREPSQRFAISRVHLVHVDHALGKQEYRMPLK
jgi:hypothetical protein